MTILKEVRVPDIGDFHDVEIIEVAVAPGQAIMAEATLITLETDKATMDVPAPYAGVVKEVRVSVGDKVSQGDLILLLETAEQGAPAQAAATPTVAAAPVAASKPAPAAPPKRPAPGAPVSAPVAAPLSADFSKPHASPAVRRFARELGVDLRRVTGSGPKARILKEDVQSFVKAVLAGAAPAGGFALPAMPVVDFAKFGAVETQPLSRIKKLSGANLHRNWVNIPHVTQFDEADITDLEAYRKSRAGAAQEEGVKLTLLAFLMKAVVEALREYPDFNASLNPEGDALILKKYFHIGVAVDTPEGLMVPVIRDVDQKSVLDLARELGTVSQKTRDKKLSPTEMQGGCFSISSLGGIGGTAFTPIINAPEVAILGVSRSVTKPVYRDGNFVPRLMLPLSLSYDHRIIDGAAAARFTTYLAGVMADVQRFAW
ncbi:MAG: dihydrolipoyllysine-residue acetyltransferase [Pseudomonadota bacterium]